MALELTGAIEAAVLGSQAGQSDVAGTSQAVVWTCTRGTVLPIYRRVRNYRHKRAGYKKKRTWGQKWKERPSTASWSHFGVLSLWLRHLQLANVASGVGWLKKTTADLTGQRLKVAVVGLAANLGVTFPGKTLVHGPLSFSVDGRAAVQRQGTVLVDC